MNEAVDIKRQDPAAVVREFLAKRSSTASPSRFGAPTSPARPESLTAPRP
jgi:hypothetical protein